MNNEQKTKLEKAKTLLNERRAACVVVSDAPYIYFDRGVRPLLIALEEGRLAGACVADRVIGKGRRCFWYAAAQPQSTHR